MGEIHSCAWSHVDDSWSLLSVSESRDKDAVDGEDGTKVDIEIPDQPLRFDGDIGPPWEGPSIVDDNPNVDIS